VYSIYFIKLACSSIDSCDHNLWVYLEAECMGCKRCTGAIPSCAVEIDESGTIYSRLHLPLLVCLSCHWASLVEPSRAPPEPESITTMPTLYGFKARLIGDPVFESAQAWRSLHFKLWKKATLEEKLPPILNRGHWLN